MKRRRHKKSRDVSEGSGAVGEASRPPVSATADEMAATESTARESGIAKDTENPHQNQDVQPEDLDEVRAERQVGPGGTVLSSSGAAREPPASATKRQSVVGAADKEAPVDHGTVESTPRRVWRRRFTRVLAFGVLVVVILATSGATVVVLKSRAEAKASFFEAHAVGLEGLTASNERIFEAIDEELRAAEIDRAGLLGATHEAYEQLVVVPFPRVEGRYEGEARGLDRAAGLEVEFLQSLAQFVAADPLAHEEDMAEGVHDQWRTLRASLNDAYRVAGREEPSFRTETSALEELTAVMVAAASERRVAADLVDERENERVQLRQELQSYYYAVAGVFNSYESMRDSLEAQDAGARVIRSSADESAFRAIFETAGAARYRLVDQLTNVVPPDQFALAHQQLVDLLTELAEITQSASYAASEAYCYEFSSDPCERVGNTSSYVGFLTEGSAVYDEYAGVRDRLTRDYEAQLKGLYRD